MSAAPAEGKGRMASIARPLAVGAVIALCCWISILTRVPGSLSTLWVSSGVLAGILITSPRNRWPAFVLAAFAANVAVRGLAGDEVYLVLSRGLASTLDALLIAFALSHWIGDVTEPARIKRAATVAAASTLVACTLSALLAAGVQAVFGGASFARVFAAWFASHSLGMVIFATLTVVARARGLRLLGKPGHRAALAVWIVLTTATCVAVFAQTRYPLLFLVYPPLLYGAFRHRFSGVVFGVALVTTAAVAGTLTGHGPFLLVPGETPTERVLLLQVFIASTCMLVLPVAVALTERGFLARSLRLSEHRYRMLADYSSDLVVRIAADGQRLYVSPSARDVLGWDLSELAGPRMDLVHPDDVDLFNQAIRELHARGGTSTFVYRARHRLGHYVWLEARAQRVPGLHEGSPPEIIYTGRDVSHRIEAERALADSQRRLRAITDNLPAYIMHLDLAERFTFANEPARRVWNVSLEQIVGTPIREIVGPRIHDEIRDKLAAARRGETVTFEIERLIDGETRQFQSTYVPEVDGDGRIVGTFVMTSDISQLKRTERELSLLARFDGLTGMANRFHFNGMLDAALDRLRAGGRPFALLFLDIDHFKRFNDQHGHAVGDGVLREFAQRLRNCLRPGDFGARLGGDEFVAIVEDVSEARTPEAIARRVIDAMREPFAVDGLSLRVTTSIGIAFCRLPSIDGDDLLRIADGMLYEAKAAGRNACRTVVVEDPARVARSDVA